MQKVELIKLELSNYRNIPHAILEFDGNCKIVGENRVGKTNTLEAIVWLLTDKLLNGGTDIASIKPLTDTKAEVRVEGTFLIDGTQTLTIRKEYGEDWVKTRGSNELVFKGHYLNYYYNDVKQKTKRDFYALLNDDFKMNVDQFKGIELLRLLTDPLYVGELGESDSWKDLRAFIISIIGDVNDDDVFQAAPSTRIIRSDLDARNGRIDELKKYYNGVIKTINEELIGFDSNIKMLEETEKPTEDELSVAKAAIESIDSNLAKITSSNDSDALLVQINKDKNNLKSRQNDIYLEAMKKNPTEKLESTLQDLNNLYHDVLSEKAKVTEEISRNEVSLESATNSLAKCVEFRKECLGELEKIDDELESNEHFNGVCPTCHRPLEGQELENAIAAYKVDLESQREDILKKGRSNKEQMQFLQERIESRKNELDDLNKKRDELTQKGKDIQSEMEKTNNALKEARTAAFELPQEYHDLQAEIDELDDRIRKIIANDSALKAAQREQIQNLMDKKAPFQKVIDDYNYAIRQFERLETVKLDRSDKQKQLALYEQKKSVVDIFIKTKLEMLDEHVSAIFGNIKFQLIKDNINGGYDPVCKPYIFNTVKDESTKTSWRSGSKSEKVVTGVAIAEKIKAALGLADFPFLFDEGGEISTETFSTRFVTNSQLICVKVQDNINKPTVIHI